MSLSNEPCMVRPTSIDLIPIEINLVYIVLMKFVMLLMTYMQKYVFQVKQQTSILKYLIWPKGSMKLKHL